MYRTELLNQEIKEVGLGNGADHLEYFLANNPGFNSDQRFLNDLGAFDIDKFRNFIIELKDFIDFLMIDIEGMEIDVLNGGKNIINSGVKIIQFEFGLCVLDREIDPDDLIGWFDKQKFDLY